MVLYLFSSLAYTERRLKLALEMAAAPAPTRFNEVDAPRTARPMPDTIGSRDSRTGQLTRSPRTHSSSATVNRGSPARRVSDNETGTYTMVIVRHRKPCLVEVVE